MTGIFGDSRENSNGAVHPGGMFSGKKLITFEVFLFSRLYRCTVPFGAKFSLVFPVKWKAPQESGIGLQLGFSLNLLEHIPGTCLHQCYFRNLSPSKQYASDTKWWKGGRCDTIILDPSC